MENTKIKAVILRNELEEDHLLWVNACTEYNEWISFRIVNLTTNNWLEEIQSEEFDILLAKPGAITAPYKTLYDERIYILAEVLGYTIYPSLQEVLIYENKRFLSFWLKANDLPHPKTNIFYSKPEAISHAELSDYPQVAKVSIGAAGSGVQILHNQEDTIKYIERCFSDKGAPRRSGPNLQKGKLLKRGLHYLIHPKDIFSKLNHYKTIKSNPQIGFVILQEFIPHNFEWRVVRIGNSFFAHKKLVKGNKASGTLLKGYGNPPLDLLDFVKEVTDKHKLYSQAVDLFESAQGYLINEMQCIFGQSDSFQMKVDGIIGRYIYKNGEWHFEKGDFNKNESYNLRVKWITETFNKKNKSF